MSRLTTFASAVMATLDDDTVSYEVGQWNDGKHGQRRRLHFYRSGGDIDTAPIAGGRETTDTVEEVTTEYRSPSPWSRYEAIEILVFAESEDAADVLLDRVIVAISETAGDGAIQWQGYEWRHDEHAQRIPMVTLRFRMILPVVERDWPLTTIAATEEECVLDV